jgi:urocanate hydratase
MNNDKLQRIRNRIATVRSSLETGEDIEGGLTSALARNAEELIEELERLRSEMPDKELIRDWMRMAHNEVEAQARAKQKAIWQSQLDEAAAEYIATKLNEL